MKKITLLSIVLVFSSMACGLTAKDAPKASNDTVIVLTLTPKMHCQNCVNKVKKNIRFEKGVKDIAVNLEKNEVTIKADKSKTDTEKLAKGFAKIGYKTTEVK